MTEQTPYEMLAQYVAEKSQNKIAQHSAEWLQAKVYTIGGSQIAVITGDAFIADVNQLVKEKIGLVKNKFNSIYLQWGNLFEEVIKQYVEKDKRTVVLGEDLYIVGEPGTSYSPDGLCVIDGRPTLLEFKCPYKRVPDGVIPSYYRPQVLYGLSMIPCVDRGLFIQGVFRRCAWEELGYDSVFDRTLSPPPAIDTPPYAYGIIGFYHDAKSFDARVKADEARGAQAVNTPNDYSLGINWLRKAYREEGFANEANSSGGGFSDDDQVATVVYESNDFGSCSEKLLKAVMNAYNVGALTPWYGEMVYFGAQSTAVISRDREREGVASITRVKEQFEKFCADNGYQNYGILPWKLAYIDHSYVERQPGFLEKHLPRIQEIVGFIRECLKPENAMRKSEMFYEWSGVKVPSMEDIESGFE